MFFFFLVKVPQIVKIWENQSAQGISFLSVLTDLFAITIAASYSFVNQFPIRYTTQCLLFIVCNLCYTGSTSFNKVWRLAKIPVCNRQIGFGLGSNVLKLQDTDHPSHWLVDSEALLTLIENSNTQSNMERIDTDSAGQTGDKSNAGCGQPRYGHICNSDDDIRLYDWIRILIVRVQSYSNSNKIISAYIFIYTVISAWPSVRRDSACS